jgi:hypothetical protein
LEALQADPLALQSHLTVFSDAAKSSAHQDEVREVRRLVREPWRFASVRVVERGENYGLSKSITLGVTELCSEHGRAIVVEDDITIAPGFLKFLNGGLVRYSDDDRVMQISGYMFPGVTAAPRHSLFLPIISCWGWATWKRAWDYYDGKAGGYAALQSDAALRRRFNLDGAYDYYGMLEQQIRGEIDSWGVRWLLSVFMRDGLVLYPPASLVQNIGVDGSGTHGSGTVTLQRQIAKSTMSTDALDYPDRLEVNDQTFADVKRLLREAHPGPLKRLIRKMLK